MAHVLTPPEFERIEHKLQHAKPGDVVPSDVLESLCMTVAYLASAMGTFADRADVFELLARA